MAEVDDIREELAQARLEIANLKLQTTTVLGPDHFLAMVFCVPLIAAFTIMGIVLVWRSLSAPQETAPYLRDWLLALSIFSNPVSAITGAVVGRWSGTEKGKATNET